MIKIKKIDDNKHLFYDEITNDPIATSHATSDTWRKNKKTYVINWHPAMKELYPEGTSSLTLRNFGATDSLEHASQRVQNRYQQLVNGPENPDPLKVKDSGNVVSKTFHFTDYGQSRQEKHKFNEYHIHDPVEGKHVASLFVNLSKANSRFDVVDGFEGSKFAHVIYHGDSPNDMQEEILKKKHPGNLPVTLVHRVKTWLETKDKEPRFIGSHTTGNSSVFKTRLPVEEAAAEYVKHLKTKDEFKNKTFNQLTPTMYYGISKSSNNLDEHHTIIDGSTPGIIKHTNFAINGPKDYLSKKLDVIID